MTAQAIMARRWPSPSSCRCNGVGRLRPPSACPTAALFQAAMPVPVTSNSARPRVTTVFISHVDALGQGDASAGNSACARLPTGWLSPVNADSSTGVVSRQQPPSAGTDPLPEGTPHLQAPAGWLNFLFTTARRTGPW